MGSNLKKNGHIYLYVELNHFTAYLKLTQHCKLTILQYKMLKCFKNT